MKTPPLKTTCLTITLSTSVPCEAGYYKDSTMTKCSKCTDNTYSKTTGSVTCIDCVPGNVSADQTQCSSGEFRYGSFGEMSGIQDFLYYLTVEILI